MRHSDASVFGRQLLAFKCDLLEVDTYLLSGLSWSLYTLKATAVIEI